MSKPESFTLTSDFATLKNDDSGRLTIHVAGSMVVPANDYAYGEATTTVGSIGASERTQMSSTKDGNSYVGSLLYLERKGTTASSGAGNAIYGIAVDVSRSSATQVKMTAFLRNPYSENLTTEAGDEDIIADVTTFIPPFA